MRYALNCLVRVSWHTPCIRRTAPIWAVPGLVAAIATAQPATLTRQELLRIAESSRGAIEDIAVEYTVMTVRGLAPDDPVFFKGETIVSKGPLFYGQTTEFRSLEFGGDAFMRVDATDGHRLTFYLAHDGMAGVRPEVDHWQANVAGREFFEINMLRPPLNETDTTTPTGSLIGLLSSEHTRVLPDLENIDGLEAHVVEFLRPNGRTGMKVWIDARRGALPLRQEYHGLDGVFFITETFDAVEVSPGVWLAVSGSVSIPHPHYGVPPEGKEIIMQVAAGKDGKPYALAVNTHPDEAVFNALRAAPPGTLVYDAIDNREYTIAGDNYRALAEATGWTWRSVGLSRQDFFRTPPQADRTHTHEEAPGTDSNDASLDKPTNAQPAPPPKRSPGMIASLTIAGAALGTALAWTIRRWYSWHA